MKVLFTILTIAGWAWTAFCAVLLVIHLARRKDGRRTDEPNIGHEQTAR